MAFGSRRARFEQCAPSQADDGLRDEASTSGEDSEERLRSLFEACDTDKDGFIGSEDLALFCRELNLTDSIEEIKEELGMAQKGRISFEDFWRVHMSLQQEIDELHRSTIDLQPPRSPHDLDPIYEQIVASSLLQDGSRKTTPLTSSTENSLDRAAPRTPSQCTSTTGEASNVPTHAWSQDSGARDVSPFPSSNHKRRADSCSSSYSCSSLWRLVESKGLAVPDSASKLMEVANQLHLSAMSKLRCELSEVRSALEASQQQREKAEQLLHHTKLSHLRLTASVEDRLQATISSYEERITELHAVIAEMTRQRREEEGRGSDVADGVIIEEEEEEDDLREDEGDSERSSQPEDEGRPPSSIASQSSRQTSTSSERPEDDQQLMCHTPPNPPMSLPPDEQYVTKVAERVQLKLIADCAQEGAAQNQMILATARDSDVVPFYRVAEQLVRGIERESDAQERLMAAKESGPSPGGGQPAARPLSKDDRLLREHQVEIERLQSRIDHLQAQNDVLSMSLEESRLTSERLSILIGKHESNETAFNLALGYADRQIELLNGLVEVTQAEARVLFANCHLAGIPLPDKESSQKPVDAKELLRRAMEQRDTAERTARRLLKRTSANVAPHSPTRPLGDQGEENSLDVALRSQLRYLSRERSRVQGTLVTLEENPLVDPSSKDPLTTAQAHKMDLENAILMQELMAVREECAELKSKSQLQERELLSLQLSLASKEVQERILRACLKEKHSTSKLSQRAVEALRNSVAASSCTRRQKNASPSTSSKLKQQLDFPAQVLPPGDQINMAALLERLARAHDEERREQTAYIGDLKKANTALLAALERTKKRNQSKLHRLEQRMAGILETHSMQLNLLRSQQGVDCQLQLRHQISSNPAGGHQGGPVTASFYGPIPHLSSPQPLVTPPSAPRPPRTNCSTATEL